MQKPRQALPESIDLGRAAGCQYKHRREMTAPSHTIQVVGLLNAGSFRPGRLVTHKFPLAEFDRAFAELATPSGTRGKVMLEVAGG